MSRRRSLSASNLIQGPFANKVWSIVVIAANHSIDRTKHWPFVAAILNSRCLNPPG